MYTIRPELSEDQQDYVFFVSVDNGEEEYLTTLSIRDHATYADMLRAMKVVLIGFAKARPEALLKAQEKAVEIQATAAKVIAWSVPDSITVDPSELATIQAAIDAANQAEMQVQIEAEQNRNEPSPDDTWADV